jgi:3-oxoacyl-[acyl-carrier protein] reductase
MGIDISLKGKTAIVTGAARGIGRAISERLSQAGASVVLADLDEGALADAQRTIPGSIAFAGDLTHPEFPNELAARAVETFGSIDILVNNAGYTWDSVIQKTSDEQFQAMLNIHAVAPFRLLRAVSGWIRDKAKTEAAAGIPAIRKVVNITSISGIDGNAGQVAYSSGKAAILGLTKTLAKEWGRYNVTVNAVGFGLVDTRLTKPMTDPTTSISIGEKKIQVGMQEKAREEMLKSIPLGRFGTTADAANAVFFFCSPLSDYVTGEILVCGGGVHF